MTEAISPASVIPTSGCRKSTGAGEHDGGPGTGPNSDATRRGMHVPAGPIPFDWTAI
jgi:hypothetical protein